MEHTHDQFRVIACPHLLSIDKGRIDVTIPEGGTVTDIMTSIGWTDGLSARVFLDGELIPDARWEYTLPKAGQSLVMRAIPMGGGQGKDAMRIVAMIGVIAASLAMPGLIGATGFWGAMLATTPGMGAALSIGTSIIGSLQINTLLPPRGAQA